MVGVICDWWLYTERGWERSSPVLSYLTRTRSVKSDVIGEIAIYQAKIKYRVLSFPESCSDQYILFYFRGTDFGSAGLSSLGI